MNLADWRLSVATWQQPRKADGGKIDFVEHTIPMPGGVMQRVTLMAPAVVGLPTPNDEDVVVALVNLWRLADTDSDILHFVPQHLFEFMRKSPNPENYTRLEQSLTRLRALTVKYERAWYCREKRGVEPVLITGVLSEAKLVRRRGRRANNRVPDSYIQWTNDFFHSIHTGNLTDLDLDFYFSLQRPTTKQLYRHLNKRWYAGKKPSVYERDLQHLACGHLGMTACKDLKRNFQAAVRELEDREYLTQASAKERFRKVRPGLYRVGFELHPSQHRKRSGGVPDNSGTEQSSRDDARELICHYHQIRFERATYTPKKHEQAVAEKLISDNDIQLLYQLLPQLVKLMKKKYPAGKYFQATEPYWPKVLREQATKNASRCRMIQEAAVSKRVESANCVKLQRHAELREQWSCLTREERDAFLSFARKHADSEFLRNTLNASHRNRGDLPALSLTLFEQWLTSSNRRSK